VLLTLLGLMLAGVAGLLAAALPWQTMPMPWLLWALPPVPLALAVLLAWRIRQQDLGSAFSSLREQMAQDLATLKLLDEEA
jgi:cytochrome c-type biogenesis protein CcmH/NrfF